MIYTSAVVEIYQLVHKGKIKEAAEYLESIVDEVIATKEARREGKENDEKQGT